MKNAKIDNIVGRRVREFRKRKKLTQAQLAEKINKTVEMVCHLENGTASTKISTLYDICEVLEIQTYQLFTNIYDFEMEEMYPELVELFMELRDMPQEAIHHILLAIRAGHK